MAAYEEVPYVEYDEYETFPEDYTVGELYYYGAHGSYGPDDYDYYQEDNPEEGMLPEMASKVEQSVGNGELSQESEAPGNQHALPAPGHTVQQDCPPQPPVSSDIEHSPLPPCAQQNNVYDDNEDDFVWPPPPPLPEVNAYAEGKNTECHHLPRPSQPFQQLTLT